jgi:hypothetical protein
VTRSRNGTDVELRAPPEHLTVVIERHGVAAGQRVQRRERVACAARRASSARRVQRYGACAARAARPAVDSSASALGDAPHAQLSDAFAGPFDALAPPLA